MNVFISILIIGLFTIGGLFLGLSVNALPAEDQMKYVRLWLTYVVTQAESMYGEKLGPLKLGWVYNRFKEAFPKLSKKIDYDTFNKYINEALQNMNELIQNNEKFKDYVNNRV